MRKSNFELLRIVAILMVIVLHYFTFCNAEDVCINENCNKLVYQIMESFCICGVNLFVLITGYFSTKQFEIKVRKIIDLLSIVAFWGGVNYFLGLVLSNIRISVSGIIKALIPFLTGGRWFVKAYIILVLLIPVINIVLNTLDRTSYLILIAILTALFSVWPSYLPSPPIDDYGFGFVHFVYLYTIAGFIRIHCKQSISKLRCIIGYIVCTGIVIGSSMTGLAMAWAYNYVFVVLASIFLFMYFRQLEIQSIIINKYSEKTFGIYLIHSEVFIEEVIYGYLFRANEFIVGNEYLLIINIIICVIGYYMIAYILEAIRKSIFKFTFDKLIDKISIFNRNIRFDCYGGREK